MTKPLLLSGVFLILSAFSSMANEKVMIVETVDGKTLTVNLVEYMSGSVWTNSQNPEAPLNFFVYTGNVGWDEDGRPIDKEDEYNPGTVYLDVPVTTLADITLRESDSAVSEIGATSINLDIQNGVVGVKGVEQPVRVTIVNSAGVTVTDRIIDADTRFDMKSMGQDVYVVKVDGTTFKFLVL